MALLKYFKKSSVLPHPNGPLSDKIPSSSIAAANNEVKDQVSSLTVNEVVKRGTYSKYSDEERTKVGKRASEMGVTNTLRFYKKEFSDKPLKESTVRTWKVQYEQELKRRHKFETGKETGVTKLVSGKRGRPFLLGNELDKRVQEYLKQMREAGGVVNATIVIGAATGIVKDFDSNLLQCNGGHIELTKSWAKSLLNRIGYVKRRATTKAKVKPADFEEYKK